ncbi:restriction endonuclease subunit S [Paenibacillus peoriae]|uniref:restriction endonuclease subunit S n=1 Tax=Paenibacillus peoriae TaxID=59893 RepID=UPI003F9D2D22
MSFEERLLHELADFQKGYAFKSSDYQPNGIKIVKVSDLTDNSIDDKSCVCIDECKTEKLDKYTLFDGDIIITTVGSWASNPASAVGKVVRVPANLNKSLLNQNAVRIRANDKIDQDYLYYVLKNSEFKDYIIGTAQGSANQASITQSDIKSYKIRIHIHEEQKKISSTLRSLDNKIELNNRMNKVLEQMAQAIFKQWFVDFEFPNGNGKPYKSSGGEMEWCEELGKEIPKGWKIGPVTDILYISPKRILTKGKKSVYLEMKNLPSFSARATDWTEREFTSGSKFMNGDVLMARITPCLENGKTVIVDFLRDDEIGWGSTEFIVLRSKNEHALGFAYFLARSDDFRNHAVRNMSGSSGRQRVPESCFDFLLLAQPPSCILELFGQITFSFLERMKRNGKETKTLSKLRDTLLPKFMSGEIDVSNIEI